MLKKVCDLSKYILAILFLILPTPIYMCIQSRKVNDIFGSLLMVVIVLIYLLLSLLAFSVVNEIRTLIISAAIVTVLLYVVCLINPNSYKFIIVPSLPFASGQLMQDIGMDCPTVLGIAIWGADKVGFGALCIVAYKSLSALKNKQRTPAIKKEIITIGIANGLSAVLVSMYTIIEEIIGGFDPTQIILLAASPFILFASMILIKFFAIFTLFDIVGVIGGIVLVVFLTLLCCAVFFGVPKLRIAEKPKIIFTVKTVGIIVLFCLYVFCIYSLNTLLP